MFRATIVLEASRLKSSDSPADGTERSVASERTGTGERPSACMIANCHRSLTLVICSPSLPR